MAFWRMHRRVRVVLLVLHQLILFFPRVLTSHGATSSETPYSLPKRSLPLVSTRRRLLTASTLSLRAGAAEGGKQQQETRHESDDVEKAHSTSTSTITRNSNATNNADGFTLLSDTLLHDHWRRLICRRVQLPSGLMAEFEIVGQRGSDEAVLVFCWNTRRKTATLVREYMPAMHGKRHGLAAGMVELHKHQNNNNSDDEDDDDMPWTAARHELEEECRLTGGRWIRLTDRECPVTMDKYSTTRLSAFLVLDPISAGTEGKARDELEEGMEVVESVTVEELRRLMKDAQLTVVGSWASLLALDKLREIGEID